MDEKRYSLRDIFAILNESFLIFHNKNVIVVSENDDGDEIKTDMSLSEFIAMSIAHELVDNYSRLACEEFTAKMENVIEAMSEAGFDEVAHPVYKCFGVIMRM